MDRRRKKLSRATMSIFLDSLGGSIDNVDVATFDSDGGDLKALVVGIDPVQDLHGYASPWPAGGGKNLFDASLFDTGTAGSIVYTSFDVPNGTYTMSTPDFPLVLGIANVFFKEGVVTSGVTSSANGVTTEKSRTITVTDGHYTVAYRSTQADNTNNPKDFKWQIESGSTATDWTPYSNICPITGHSSVNVIVSPTLNPLDGTITNIPLGGTYYGGQLDVLTGVLTLDRALFTLDSALTAAQISIDSFPTYTRVAYAPYNNVGKPLTGFISNIFKDNGTYAELYCVWHSTSSTAARMWFGLPTTVTTREEAITWFTSNPTQVVYELATPTTVQLTGQQISTFLGTNNVWCDSGKIIHLEY